MSDLHPAFVESLATERESLNKRFAQRLRAGARVEPQAFMAHLRDTVNPSIAAVDAVFPERVRGVVVALYEISLELFAASLLGPQAKQPVIAQLWREVLPATAKLLAREPQRVAGSLTNAVHQIASQSGTRPLDWLTRLHEVASECTSVDQLLDAGKIIAWQSGMVQYRSAALQTVLRMPHNVAVRALRLPATTSAQQLKATVDRSTRNLWWRWNSNGGQTDGKPELKVVAAVGAFRGFGGPFLRPPTIRCQDNHLFVSDGMFEWQLLADAFGTLFQRVGDALPAAEREQAARQGSDRNAEINRKGEVSWGNDNARFPHLADATSSACDGSTLGVTIATSHHVFLIGRSGA